MIMTKYIETPLNERFDAKFEIARLRETDESVRAIRKEASEFFQQNGFPSIKNEEWRFTNMLPFLKEEYELDVLEHTVSPEEFKRTAELVSGHLESINDSMKGEHKGAYRLVTINGQLNRELSVFPEEGFLEVVPFAAAGNHPAFQKYFGKIAQINYAPDLNSLKFGKVSKSDGFTALNTALFNNGLMLVVPANKVIDKPVHLVNVFLSETNIWLHPRHLIVLGKNAAMDLIETNLSDRHSHHVFVNGVTEIALETQAQFNHYDIQTGRENMRFVQRTEASQQKHSNYSNYTFTFPGTDIVRNTLNLHLNQDEAESHLYGLYFTDGKQIVDNHTEVHHKFPNCESNQLYKGVMAGNSKAVFNGKIYVYEDAQKTNAFQQSNNILLSEKATVDAKPQLEIFADDVKASHGTTVGQLDREALFYLKSRGIGEQSAKNMMINAFAFDVTQKVKHEALRKYLEKLIAGKMKEVSL